MFIRELVKYKEQERKKIEAQMREFLDSGKEIKEIPKGISGEEIKMKGRYLVTCKKTQKQIEHEIQKFINTHPRKS